MANAVNVNFRMDPDLKRNMEEVLRRDGTFYDNGIHDFRQKVSREHRIPFEVSADRSTRKATSIISARSSTTSIQEKPSSLSTI